MTGIDPEYADTETPGAGFPSDPRAEKWMIVGGPVIPASAIGEVDVGGAAVVVAVDRGCADVIVAPGRLVDVGGAAAVVAVDRCCADVLVASGRLVVDDGRPAAVLSSVAIGIWLAVVPVVAALVVEPDVRTGGAARVVVVINFGGGRRAESVDGRVDCADRSLDAVGRWLDSVEG